MEEEEDVTYPPPPPMYTSGSRTPQDLACSSAREGVKYIPFAGSIKLSVSYLFLT